MKKKIYVSLIALLTAMGINAQEAAPAFPGAEGYARYTTTGGRGGNIVHVTNLNDSGTGSFRAAATSSTKSIIVFDVSGVIELKSDLTIKGNKTILGQTAPGEGITLRYRTLLFGGDNIILRFIRVRRGQEKDVNDGADATWTRQHKNIILDHCSFSWSIDEVASFYDNRDFTMQWCTIAEALNNAGHGKGAHGYGGIWGGKGATFHHNFLAHLNNRSPRFNGARYTWDGFDKTKFANTVLAEQVDFRNCVVYNWGSGGCYGGPGGGFVNMINNYYKAGPATSSKNRVTSCSMADSGNSSGCDTKIMGLYSRYFISGNYVHGYGENYDWKGVVYDKGNTMTDVYNMYGQGENAVIPVKLDAEVPMAAVTTHKAEDAYEKVLAYAGASLKRDMADERYMEEASTGTARYKGSVTGKYGLIDVVADQGTYSIRTAGETHPAGYDTDNDGIPDAWEIANGLNPNDASDAKTYTIDTKGYYTNLEVYANSIVEHIVKAQNADAISAIEEYYPACVNPLSIESANVGEGSVKSVDYFTAQGIKTNSNAKGIVMKAITLNDGTKRVIKVVK